MFLYQTDYTTLTAIPFENESPESTHKRTSEMMAILDKHIKASSPKIKRVVDEINTNIKKQGRMMIEKNEIKKELETLKPGTTEFSKKESEKIALERKIEKLKNLENYLRETEQLLIEERDTPEIMKILSLMHRYYGVSEIT